MEQEIMERCMVRTAILLLNEDESIVVEVDNKKYLVMRSEDKPDIEVAISEIKNEDDVFFQELSEGEIIFTEPE